MTDQFNQVLSAYNINDKDCIVKPFGTGLINNTWKIIDGKKEYILQCINSKVFKRPEDIVFNIRLLAEYFFTHHPGYLFVVPLQTNDKADVVFNEQNRCFRLFPFIKNSRTINAVSNVRQTFEAAKQFGRFTKLLSAFDVNKLRIPLPHFHDLPLRYYQFEEALISGNKKRIKESKQAIKFIQQQKIIADEFEQIKLSPYFKLRVTHHDTKISNVLFDENDKGLCVIDLDTVMPGYFISDVGDMMRTYLSPANEEEKDFTAIKIRNEYFTAIVSGYLSEMESELTLTEKNYFVYAGRFMIYMQVLRFLTDYLNNDIYYGSKYEKQNFVRANNQIVLLEKLNEANLL